MICAYGTLVRMTDSNCNIIREKLKLQNKLLKQSISDFARSYDL